MQLTILNPRKGLNKAYLKVKPLRSDMERFKHNLIALLDGMDESETEEHAKNDLGNFLRNTFYQPRFYINTKDQTDLVIHNGPDAKSPAGVLIEAKKPSNKTEMIRSDNLNVKAFHELVLYYMRERITGHNLEIKHLVVTNIYEWFVFDAGLFDRLFAQNKAFVKQFTDFEEGRLTGRTTDFFYKEIVEPFLAALTEEIIFTCFDFRQYDKPLRNNDKADDSRLIALFKLLSPEHLLKLPFANDSNSLDKAFYAELLHIIGLTETKEGAKKLINRKKEGDRNSGSFIESAIEQIESLDKISRLEKPSQFGATTQERLFNIALELAITWINRILFLKLLEAQLIKYHKGDESYAFLHDEKVKDFDDLNSLFFSVLARKPEERSNEVKMMFAHVPYLNSSLFEPTSIEHSCLFISQLKDGKLPVFASTVLKDNQGNKIKGELVTLKYLFRFLDAYDFASEGAEEIQEDNKTLINASVLGLIFEKINGYKDGSFFTPGFITMYMCRETIRRAVVHKFNDAKGWNCATLDDVYDRINDRTEANIIINSLKICDIAVGSGHFLVSALNEIIAIKSDLRILQDRNGRRLKEYHVEVVNDELVVTDEDGELFEYNPGNHESQRIQQTLFHEKQTIIENCLFGVDINPNSVKICRLRLWIELLKNAYYRGVETHGRASLHPESPLEGGRGVLETLPNIDINIKCGNSLISRYAIDTDIKRVLKKGKWDIFSYRLAVMTYRNATTKEQKREMERLIDLIKKDFILELSQNHPLVKKKIKINSQITDRFTSWFLFEPESDYGNEKMKELAKKERQKLESEAVKIDHLIEEIKNNPIYENAFEWRFEFPEVLNDDGDFIGFDLVIGNPPYIRQEEISLVKPYLSSNYEVFNGTADLYTYFVEKGLSILAQNGEFIFIIPNKWMRASYGKTLRNFVKSFAIQQIVDFGDLPVFEEATTYPSILHLNKSQSVNSFKAVNVETLNYPEGIFTYLEKNKMNVMTNELTEQGWSLTNTKVQQLLSKLKSIGTPLGEYVMGRIFRGVLTGLNEAFVIDEKTRQRLISEDPGCDEIIKPFLAGRDIKRYQQPLSNKFLIFTRRGIDIQRYPAILRHLENFKERLEPKPVDFDGEKWLGRKTGKYKWYEIQDAIDYYQEFENEKIIYPNICSRPEFTFDDSRNFTNQKCFIITHFDKALIGILNSQLTFFLFKSILPRLRGDFYEPSYLYFKDFPIVKDTSGKLEILVNQILSLKKSDPAANTTSHEKEIDQLVYELYSLTAEEIKIVEGS